MSDNSGMILDGKARIPDLEDGKQYKLLGVLESVMQEDKLVLACAAKEYLRPMSIICTSFLSDYNHLTDLNLAGPWLPHVDTTVVDNGYTGDR